MSYRFAYGNTPNELNEAVFVGNDDYVIVALETSPTELKRAKKITLAQTLPSNLVYIDTVTPSYDAEVLADNPFCFIPFHSEAGFKFTTHAGARFRYGVGEHSVVFRYTNRIVKGYGNGIGFSTDGGNVLALSRASHTGFDIYQNRTIEFWLRYATSGNSATQQFIADQQQFGESTTFTTNAQFGISSNIANYNTTGNKIGWFANFTTSGTEYKFVSNAALVSNTIYHIVFTLDTTTLRLYINGVLDKSQAHDQKSKGTSGNILIGRGSGAVSFPDVPNGIFSGFAFYDYVLSAERVLAHYNAGKV